MEFYSSPASSLEDLAQLVFAKDELVVEPREEALDWAVEFDPELGAIDDALGFCSSPSIESLATVVAVKGAGCAVQRELRVRAHLADIERAMQASGTEMCGAGASANAASANAASANAASANAASANAASANAARTATFSHPPQPSSSCHICGRKCARVPALVCRNLRSFTCKKVVCSGCAEKHLSESQRALADGEWVCCHCSKVCPPSARCHTYRKSNSKRKTLYAQLKSAAPACSADVSQSPKCRKL